MKRPLCVPNPSIPGGLKPVELITDRAKRYRAQHNVAGPRRCVICGARPAKGKRAGSIDVMHLSGDETDGDRKNLAYGCRSCNAALGAAFKALGSKIRTRQYNPERGGPPTFEQWKWAVVHHMRGAEDEGGKIIHATPRHLRIKYNREIYELRRRRGDFEVPF